MSYPPSRRANHVKRLISVALLTLLWTSYVCPAAYTSGRPSARARAVEVAAHDRAARTSAPAEPPARRPPDSPADLRKPDPATRRQVSEAYSQLALSFEANNGQADARAKFISRGDGYKLLLTPREAVMVLSRPEVKAAGNGLEGKGKIKSPLQNLSR